MSHLSPLHVVVHSAWSLKIIGTLDYRMSRGGESYSNYMNPGKSIPLYRVKHSSSGRRSKVRFEALASLLPLTLHLALTFRHSIY
jgi:hypothetical protein